MYQCDYLALQNNKNISFKFSMLDLILYIIYADIQVTRAFCFNLCEEKQHQMLMLDYGLEAKWNVNFVESVQL